MNRGQYFEDLAAGILRRAGLKIIERNFRCKPGEIDLVCRDGRTLVFVEVRYRAQTRFASALASITPAKQRRLIAAAQIYLLQRGLANNTACRFDIVGFDGERPGEDGIQWLKNAIGT